MKNGLPAFTKTLTSMAQRFACRKFALSHNSTDGNLMADLCLCGVLHTPLLHHSKKNLICV